jgi:hypothetical protein
MHMTSGTRCAICGSHYPHPSLHHIHKHPRDDVAANLMWLCGSGTTGCHGLVEHRDPATMEALQHVLAGRHDFLRYLTALLGGGRQAQAWIDNLTRRRT